MLTCAGRPAHRLRIGQKFGVFSNSVVSPPRSQRFQCIACCKRSVCVRWCRLGSGEEGAPRALPAEERVAADL